jgi:hypothetical protein
MTFNKPLISKTSWWRLSGFSSVAASFLNSRQAAIMALLNGIVSG